MKAFYRLYGQKVKIGVSAWETKWQKRRKTYLMFDWYMCNARFYKKQVDWHFSGKIRLNKVIQDKHYKFLSKLKIIIICTTFLWITSLKVTIWVLYKIQMPKEKLRYKLNFENVTETKFWDWSGTCCFKLVYRLFLLCLYLLLFFCLVFFCIGGGARLSIWYIDNCSKHTNYFRLSFT